MATSVETVETSAKAEPKKVIYNGNIVPDELKEIGYGDWMLVTRRNPIRSKPNGSAQQGDQRGNKHQPQSDLKDTSTYASSKPDNGKNKGHIAQAWKNKC